MSDWIIPGQIVDMITKTNGTEVKFQEVAEDVFCQKAVAKEMTENMVLVGDYGYFGKGQEKERVRVIRCLKGGVRENSWEDFVIENELSFSVGILKWMLAR